VLPALQRGKATGSWVLHSTAVLMYTIAAERTHHQSDPEDIVLPFM
jgi:hypothetical protein